MFYKSAKKVCISFDWHNDRNYRHLLSAWNANPNSGFEFVDLTSGEIDTDDVSRVKAVITTKIRSATHTLVIIGAQANEIHRDRAKIGYRNWIWWEIEQSKAAGNQLVAVKIDKTYPTPDPLLNSGAKWAMSFTTDAIIKALNEV